MAKPKVLLLRAPGTNCDLETAYAFEQAGAIAERVHLNRVIENPAMVEDFQILCLPGGFSYGDDISAGRIVATQIRHHLSQAMQHFKDHDKLILGVCNGFQILIKSGLLLPDDDEGLPQATLGWNDSLRFEDRWVRLRTEGQKCVFLQGIDSLYLPIAHAEGKFSAKDAKVLDSLEQAGQLCLRYASLNGSDREIGFPDNPNGAQRNVAGVCDETGRVFGLMPHPERFIDPTQHPRWTRGEAGDEGEGLAIFRNAVGYFG